MICKVSYVSVEWNMSVASLIIWYQNSSHDVIYSDRSVKNMLLFNAMMV
jgi:hypothetical protein